MRVVGSIRLQSLYFVFLEFLVGLFQFVDLLVDFLLPLDSVFSESREGLFNVGVVLGRCLNVGHVSILLAEPLQGNCGNLPIFILDIKFVADHNEGESLRHTHHSLGEERLLPVGK